MYATLINGCGIALGGLIGWGLKKKINQNMQNSLSQMVGICIILISISGIVSNMLKIKDGMLVSSGEIIIIICLVVGTFVGELFNFEKYTLSSNNENKTFIAGFINSSILFSVGAMEIVGPLNSVLINDNSILLTKSMVDFTFAIILGVYFGGSVMLGALPTMAIQFIIAIFAIYLNDFITVEILSQISAIAYVIFLCTGINMIFSKRVKFKTVNMLPALILPLILSAITRF